MNESSRKTWLAWTTRAVVVLLILAVGIGITYTLQTTAPTTETAAPKTTLPQVKVFSARAVQLQRQWNGFGNARALDSADVPARVAAIVKDKSPALLPGTPIHFGDTVVLLDDSDYLKQRAIAKEKLDDLQAQLTTLDIEEKRLKERIAIDEMEVQIASNELKRVEDVFKGAAGKPRELDAARQSLLIVERGLLQSREMLDKFPPRRLQWQAALNTQQQQYELADLNVKRCRITSPIDGVIQSIDVEIGENVALGQRVARVVNPAKIEVAVQLPAAARHQVLVGSTVELQSSSDSKLLCEAKVRRLSPEDDAATRTMTAYIEVDQTERLKATGPGATDQLITPGQFLSATAWSDQVEMRWVVPRRSIRTGRIMVVEEGLVRSRVVAIDYLSEKKLPEFGLPDDQWAVLLKNAQPLKEGELVIVNASIAVRDGDHVTPVLPKEPETTPPPEATTLKPEANRAEAKP
ncbi:MAG: HlyD family efflux transporter periplasmic adaptor subunit [Phycisphaeraceae bacterium]